MPARRALLAGVGVGLTGSLSTGSLSVAADSDDSSETRAPQEEQKETTQETQDATVDVNTDRTDPETIVADATVPDGGFIVISFTEAGPPVATSAYLTPGSHEDVPVERGENDYVEKGDTARYDVRLARDTDDDKTFDVQTDSYYDGDRSLQAITMTRNDGCEVTVETSYPG